MNLRRITDATSEALTLEDARQQLNMLPTDTFDDPRIWRLIITVRHECEGLIHRSIMPTTWEVTMEDWPDVIELSRPPVTSIVTAQYIDEDGDAQALTTYELDTDTEPARVIPAYDTEWPAIRSKPGAIRIRYVAGYANRDAVPMPLRQWMLIRLDQYYHGCEQANEAAMASHPLLAPYICWVRH
jgi:uncharacterized phiE125 gp8 family phage protein